MDDMQGFMATQRRADIDARLRALASTVIKKNNLGRCDKQIIKK